MILAKFKMNQNYSLFTLLERTGNANRRKESLEADGENRSLIGVYRRLHHISFSRVSLLCFEHVNGIAICRKNPS